MKKFYTIAISLLMILSGMHFSLARHFCNGEVYSTHISTNGNNFSCGMHSNHAEPPLKGTILTSQCCRNEVYSAVVDYQYLPSEKYGTIPLFDVDNFTLAFSILSQAGIAAVNANLADSPPGFAASSVSQQKICVFRI